EAYDRGTAAHRRGDFAAAATEFALADEIAPSSVALQAALDAAIKADDAALGSDLLERSQRAPVAGALAARVKAASAAFAHRAGRLRAVCAEAPQCLATVDGKPLTIGKPAWV